MTPIGNAETVFLKITSAIAVAGEIVLPGSIMEFAEHEAKMLLHSGRAELATLEDSVSAAAARAVKEVKEDVAEVVDAIEPEEQEVVHIVDAAAPEENVEAGQAETDQK